MKILKKTLKYFSRAILIYIFLCLITPFNKTLRNRSIKNQISYLSNILDRGYDDRLQRRFPEGKLFSNSILALSTIEYCEKTSNANIQYARIVDNCIKRIQSKRALSIFNPNMKPKYGMFHNAWSNYLYTTYRESKLFNHSFISEKVIKESKLIEDRLTNLQKDSIQVLDTYIDANWPADNLIGILSLTDNQLKYKWIEKILSQSKHNSGLVHHAGSDQSKIRGSSNAMIVYCLNKAGYEEIEKYNSIFKNVFVDEFLGIQLVKENEDGSNSMDADSGPVVFGYGASATIMNIKTQASLNNIQSKFTWASMNLIGFPINIFKKKFYIMKKEPMLDLFMLWGSTEW